MLLLAYALLVGAGLSVVLARDPNPTTPSRATAAAIHGNDLAHAWRGARARVSSFNVRQQHHPLYAIDGRRSRDRSQKWMSHKSDQHPWIEVLFPTPVKATAVSLVHAGHTESKRLTARNYTIRCFADDESIFEIEVRDNEESVAVHDVVCPGVERLRLDFELDSGQLNGIRLYEIEVLGESG